MSAFDILGASSFSINSFIALVQVIKRNADCHQEVKTYFEKLEKLSSRIQSKISELKAHLESSSEPCQFFASIEEKIKGIYDQYSDIHDEIKDRYFAVNFFKSPDLARRLDAILMELKSFDNVLDGFGFFTNLMTRNQPGGVANAVTIIKYLPYDSRALEYLKKDIERKEEEDIDLGTSDPILEICSLEFRGRKNFGLGLTYYTGELENNYSHAFRCFTAAFNHGTWEAAYYLGRMYYTGRGVTKNYDKAYNHFLVGAGKGHGDSLYEISRFLLFGEGTEIDFDGHSQFVKRSAEAGSMKGAWSYGFRLLYGQGTKPNPAQGFKLLQRASKGDEPRANNELAQCYEHGIGVDFRSPSKAYEFQRKAYDAGVRWSARNIGSYYERGLGVPQDLGKAAEVYRIAYENGGQEGLYTQGHYGMCLIRGRGVRKNVRRGLQILRESCIDNSTIGWNLLGDCYRYGYGVKRNADQAIYFYTQATKAKVGMRAMNQAHKSLGDMYEKGERVPKSQKQAAFHFMYAAERHDAEAQLKVALMFEAGNGLDQNTDRAVLYFKFSARGGNELAQLKSGEYIHKGHGVEHPRKMDIEAVEAVAEQGDIGARNFLRKISNRIRNKSI